MRSTLGRMSLSGPHFGRVEFIGASAHDKKKFLLRGRSRKLSWITDGYMGAGICRVINFSVILCIFKIR